jgi:hypothetical protein
MPKASAGDPRARKRFRVEPKVIALYGQQSVLCQSAKAVLLCSNAQPALRFSPWPKALFTAPGLAAWSAGQPKLW